MILQSLQNFRSWPMSQQNLRHVWEAQAWFQTGMRPKVIGLASSHQMWRSTLPWKRRSMCWQRHVICLFRMTTQSLRYDSFLNEQIKFCFNCFQGDILLGTSDMIIMWWLSSRVIMRKLAQRIQMKMVICHCCGQRNVPLPTQPNSCWSWCTKLCRYCNNACALCNVCSLIWCQFRCFGWGEGWNMLFCQWFPFLYFVLLKSSHSSLMCAHDQACDASVTFKDFLCIFLWSQCSLLWYHGACRMHVCQLHR